MKILDYNKSNDAEVVITLGFFDSIHLGHIELIKKAQEVSKELDASSAVFTFTNDIDKVLGFDGGLVLTYDERLKKLSKLSVEYVISAIFTKEFSELNPEEFFAKLITSVKVKSIVCGEDYRFGCKGLGDVKLLRKLCDKAKIPLFVLSDVTSKSKRISTTRIKELLSCGDIEEANYLLGDNYLISGVVCKGRQVGRQMGFPTANILISSEKFAIKTGVYKTHVILNGNVYNCITNYGGRPTFNLRDVLVETYIDGFEGDLYGKEITVYFDEYMRQCVKFDSVEDLTMQLQKDLEKIRW